MPHREWALWRYLNPLCLDYWAAVKHLQEKLRTLWWSLLSHTTSFPTSAQCTERLLLISSNIKLPWDSTVVLWSRCVGLTHGARGTVLTHQSPGDTTPANSQQLIHLSLQLLAAPRSTESAPELIHCREQESRPSQDSLFIHGLQPQTRVGDMGQEWHTEQEDNGGWCVLPFPLLRSSQTASVPPWEARGQRQVWPILPPLSTYLLYATKHIMYDYTHYARNTSQALHP